MDTSGRFSAHLTTPYELVVDEAVWLVAGELPYAEVVRAVERRCRDLDPTCVSDVRRLEIVEDVGFGKWCLAAR